MGRFCCKTACFFLFGVAHLPSRQRGPRTGSGESFFLKKQNGKKEGKLVCSWVTMAMQGVVCVEGFLVWVKLALPASHRFLLTNMQLSGLLCPRNRNTVMLSSNSTDLGLFCFFFVSDGRFAREVYGVAVWGWGEQPYCSWWEKLGLKTIVL